MNYTRYFSIKTCVAVICFYLTACATITVNVYFPAEEVREAYTSLEEEFLTEPQETEESTDPTPTTNEDNKTEPQGKVIYPDEPVLTSETKRIVLKREVTLDFSEYAWAQGNIAGQISNKIRKMPQVIDAYKRRSQRQTTINQMLSGGLVAEGPKGLLVQKTGLSPEQTKAFNDENKDRQVIIRGMARAIVEINQIEPTPENINKVLPEAAKQFAAVRRSESR